MILWELRRPERPDPSWVRGRCPLCGSDLVSNAYRVGGQPGGYIIVRECWEGLGEVEDRTCDYREEWT